MNDINMEIKNFIDIIKNTSEYNDYIKSKKLIESKPDLKANLDYFRKQAFEVQLNSNYGEYNNFEQISTLKRENEELLNNVFAKEFLENELRLTKMMRNIMNSLVDNLDFNIDFLD